MGIQKKTGWRFHNTISELEEWRAWVLNSAQQFHDELLKYGKGKPGIGGLVQNQVDGGVRLREELTTIINAITQMNKDVRKIKGRRIHRPTASDA